MDHFSTENTDFDFDDNGLKDVRLPASGQQIASGDCIRYKPREDLMLSHCDANPIERDEDETTKVAFSDTKSCLDPLSGEAWGTSLFNVHPEIINDLGLYDEENEQSLPNRGKDFKEEIRLRDGFDYHLRRIHMMCRRIIFPKNDEESKQEFPNLEKDLKKRKRLKHDLKFHLCHTFKTEGAGNVVGRSKTRSGKVGATETKFRSERSVKDRGCLSLYMPLSLASFCEISFASMSWKFCISFAFVILSVMPSIGVEGALPSIPDNTLFVVGETARMNCSTDLNQPVYWTRTLAGSDIQQWLYYGKNGFNTKNADERFSIDKDEATGRYDIIIADVQLRDAGQYTCVDEAGLGARASAELVVSDPIKCDSHIPSDGVMGYNVFGLKQDFIHFSCSLTYTGNLSPTLEWSWPGSDVQRSPRAVSNATSSVTATLKFSPSKELNNTRVRCEASIESATQNIINGRLWESEIVNVRYSEFAPKDLDVCPGVKWNLVCNPQCSYQLEKIENDCQCLYKYYDARTQHNFEITSDVVRCGIRRDSPAKISVIVVSVVASLIMVIMVGLSVCMAVFCLRRKNTKRAERYDETTKKGVLRGGYRKSEAVCFTPD